MSRKVQVRPRPTSRLVTPFWIAVILCFFAHTLVLAEGSTTILTNTVLTNAADVLALSAEQAKSHIPVVVRGVVTAAEASWQGEFFLQDATSGVYIENHSDTHPEPGDLVEVKGFTRPGAFAPTVAKLSWTKLGTAPLPKAQRVPLDRLMSGLEDGQRVEVVGIVRATGANQTNQNLNMDLELATDGYRIHTFPPIMPGLDPKSLIGDRVRIRGTAAASWNAHLRHLVTVVIFVPLTNDFKIEQREAISPFEKPIIPLSGTAEYRHDILPGERIHVKGVVTLQRPGQDLFLQDATGGLHVQTTAPLAQWARQTNIVSVGDVVEAVGFSEYEHFLPVLNDAVFRKTSEPPSAPKPKKVSIQEIQMGWHHADVVILDAKLLERTVRASQTKPNANLVTLLLQSQDPGRDAERLVYSAEAEVPESDTKLTSVPIGSRIEVTGVCFLQNSADKKLQSLQLLLPDSNSVRVLKEPSWFTAQRLAAGLAILFAVLVVAMSWSVMVSKKNSVLRMLIREREAAQLGLQQAHDQLEERVKERTAQLKFQITARKESEVQFKAVLKERTRLAQELHDTLEQTLTGIALQLDTTSKLFTARPDGANHHLELARGLVAQSQVDVRRSVWDLRSRALEQFDLPGALSASGKQLTDGTNIHFEVSAGGRVRPLPEIIEENLLRIAQEALTNVIKHSQATVVGIQLDYGPQNVTLEIKDNGRGFEREKSAGPGEGHFGLLGISERAKRLGAELSVTSETGHGTTIRIQVPIGENSPDFMPSEALS